MSLAIVVQDSISERGVRTFCREKELTLYIWKYNKELTRSNQPALLLLILLKREAVAVSIRRILEWTFLKILEGRIAGALDLALLLVAHCCSCLG